MAVSYKANPQDREAVKKFYAQAKGRSELTFKKLSKEIAEGSTTVSDTDVLAVLNDLTKALRRHLENGEIVRYRILPVLCRFVLLQQSPCQCANRLEPL